MASARGPQAASRGKAPARRIVQLRRRTRIVKALDASGHEYFPAIQQGRRVVGTRAAHAARGRKASAGRIVQFCRRARIGTVYSSRYEYLPIIQPGGRVVGAHGCHAACGLEAMREYVNRDVVGCRYLPHSVRHRHADGIRPEFGRCAGEGSVRPER